MARQAKEEDQRAPCFGNFDPKGETCDPEVCVDLEDCKVKTETGEEQTEQVDLDSMDMSALLEFAEAQGIELSFDADSEPDEADVRMAIYEAMVGTEEEVEPEPEEAEPEPEEAEPEPEVAEPEPETAEPEGAEPEAEEPEPEVPTTGKKIGKPGMYRKAPSGGAIVERLSDGVIPAAFKPFKEALKKTYGVGSIREKKSIVNIIVDDSMFMGIARRESTVDKVSCIVYRSGKWALPKGVESKIARWNDSRHNNEIKIVVQADKIDPALKLIAELAIIAKKQNVTVPAKPAAKPAEKAVAKPVAKPAAKVIAKPAAKVKLPVVPKKK